jgi:hypothetical protein
MQTGVHPASQTYARGPPAQYRDEGPGGATKLGDGLVALLVVRQAFRARRGHRLRRQADCDRRAGARAAPHRIGGAQKCQAAPAVSRRHDHLDRPLGRATPPRRWRAGHGQALHRPDHGFELAGASGPAHRTVCAHGPGCVPRTPACTEPRSAAAVSGRPGERKRPGERGASPAVSAIGGPGSMTSEAMVGRVRSLRRYEGRRGPDLDASRGSRRERRGLLRHRARGSGRALVRVAAGHDGRSRTTGGSRAAAQGHGVGPGGDVSDGR